MRSGLVRSNPIRTFRPSLSFPDFCYFLWKLCQIKSFQTKRHIWSILKIFVFCDYQRFLEKIVHKRKNHKKLKFSIKTKYDFLWSKMTKSDIISTKNSKGSSGKSEEVRRSPVKSGSKLRSGNKVSQNTFKKTSEMTWMFCDTISYSTSKYRPDFLGLRKLLDRLLGRLLGKSLIPFYF